VITAVDYWAEIYSSQIIFKYTIAYMVPNLVGLVFVVLWGPRIPAAFRIIPGFMLFIVVVIVVIIVHNATLSIFLMGLLGFSDSVVQGSVYGLAGQFPPKYVGAVMAGNGVSGVSSKYQEIGQNLQFNQTNY
jgi:equilibrative nucleoside transporter 1/2/3